MITFKPWQAVKDKVSKGDYINEASFAVDLVGAIAIVPEVSSTVQLARIFKKVMEPIPHMQGCDAKEVRMERMRILESILDILETPK